MVTSINDVNLTFGCSRLQDGVADYGRFIPILKICTDWRYCLVVDDAVKHVGDFVNKRVLPANDVTLWPPVFPPGMMWLGNEYIVETLGRVWCIVHPIHFQFAQTFQVKADAALFAVDLQHFVVFASGSKAGGFEGADCAVGKGDGGDEGVIDGDLAGAAAIGKRPLFHPPNIGPNQ